MALRMKLKLPSLCVTQISTAGEVTHRTIPRGCIQQGESELLDSEDGPRPNDGVPRVIDGVHPNDGDQQAASNVSGGFDNLPSLHEIARKSAIESWRKVRPSLLQAAIENSAMPPSQACMMCCVNEASYRCLQCGPRIFFCHHCFGDAHSTTNLFHTGEVWEV